MSQTDQIEARARFLQEAAQFLAVSSPTTAAFIGRAHNKLIEDGELEIPIKEADACRRSICNACGNFMIPGWSCKVSSHLPGIDSTREDGNKSKKQLKLEKTIHYTCLMCHRQTHQALRQKPRRKNEKSIPLRNAEPVPVSGKPPVKEIDNAPKTLNASSKQRQKARKGGLQAMLDKKKSQNSANGGLDLLDFAM